MLSKERFIHLLKKYDVPGPRYTSYPTVPAWTDQVGVEDYQKSLKSLKKGECLSLYFHLPFCENLCHFCGCIQFITKDHLRSGPYVDRINGEVDRVATCIPKDVREVSQLHFGGGSPNFFQPNELCRIVEKVREHFTLLPDAEMAIEMHPRTSTREFCEILPELGFNRISLGVQDFDPKVQKLINRNQTYEMTRDMVELFRDLGFKAFNFDLVYGLPGQNSEGWTKTLRQVLEMRPDRLAVYSYAHVPWVKPVQRTFKDSDVPSPEMKLHFFETAYTTLMQNGYRLIGMDHFALKEDELSRALDNGTIHRNFMGYSTKADAHQIGFGMSGISYVGGNYFQNLKKIKEYESAMDQGKMATFRGFLLSQDDHLHRDLIMQIMCRGCVKIKEFSEKWQIPFNDYFQENLSHLKPFVEDGLLEVNVDELRVIGEGFLFLRNMAMQFDPYLEKIKAESTTPIFSRTV